METRPFEPLGVTTYSDVKGFNYVPSYAATIWDAIEKFDRAVWDREFGYSKRFRANALRIWCDYLSFQKDEQRFLKTWESILGLAQKHDLKIMVTLANRWVDAQWPYGQIDLALILRGAPDSEYERYLRAFVGAFREHSQVLMWDLCNEPFSVIGTLPDDRGLFKTMMLEQEMKFWRGVAEAVRSAKPSQPITLGLHTSHEWNPEPVNDIVDVISCHPYRNWWEPEALGFQDLLDYYIRVANSRKKGLICTETVQGSKSNPVRAKIIQISIRELERRKIGWLAWQLMGGKHVASRWDRTDKNCRPGDDSVMYWVETDGITRPGHDEKEWRNWK